MRNRIRRVTYGKWCIRSAVPAGVENADVRSYSTVICKWLFLEHLKLNDLSEMLNQR